MPPANTAGKEQKVKTILFVHPQMLAKCCSVFNIMWLQVAFPAAKQDSCMTLAWGLHLTMEEDACSLLDTV